ncbi:MAG: DUF4479 and tRNA-binding domain-containing protein [Aerococcus sp.]|nr:DUF4479 and tRNA-binding domain-containing protein [Aerococcus sp.]
MWLSFYNPKGVGDVLMLVAGDLPRERTAAETQANITRIYDNQTNDTVGYNVDHISDYFTIHDEGHVVLSDEQLEQLNQRLYEFGFDPIEIDRTPRLVAAHVLSVTPHPDSDHLSITQTEVGLEEPLQIVCGAANVHEDMTSIAALSDAVMPNGQIIRPGELRGVESFGMLCSAYELGLDPEHQLKGILDLDEAYAPGTPLEDIIDQIK